MAEARPGPSLKISFVVLGVGVALAITGGVAAGVTFFKSVLGGSAVSLPAHLHRHLDAGGYEVYQRTGSRSGDNGFTFSNGQSVPLQPDDVRVPGGTGQQVVTEPAAAHTETLTRGSAIYTG